MNKTKVFRFGKMDYYGNGRHSNAVEVEVEIKDWNGYDEFTICAGIWNSKRTDYVRCGQCLDYINENTKVIKHNPLFKELYRLWTLYHLKALSDIPADDLKKIYDLMEVK